MRSVTDIFSGQQINWSSPPEDWVLSDDGVHVWVGNLDQPETSFKELARMLSPDEQERASRFQFRQDRHHFTVARGFLRDILSCYTKISANELRFYYGQNGKPSLVLPPGLADWQFNLSHSGGLALYAVSRNRQLGIDLEKISICTDMDDVAARCFLPEEQIALQSLEPQQKAENFFRYWTRKEAQLKCSGEGFSSASESDLHFTGTLLELEPAEGYMAALAVLGKPFQMETWQWQGERISSKLAGA